MGTIARGLPFCEVVSENRWLRDRSADVNARIEENRPKPGDSQLRKRRLLSSWSTLI
jgi:hypothetical protein